MTGIVNPNIKFYLSRGNPSNDKVGMSIDQQVFGKSLGGQIFTKETLLNGQEIDQSLSTTKNTLIFDPLVLSDIVKSTVNYRALYIFNPSSDHVILDNITVEVIKSQYLDDDLCDVDIATEGYYTLGELNRPIPNVLGTANNPSIFLDDEYDSTNKLQTLVFKKILDANDLPADIPTNCALKLWIRRKCIVNRLTIPDGEYWENIKLTVNEYNNEYTTPFEITYVKEDGRLPLSNWYDYSITPGKGTSIILKELLPKEIDLTNVTPLNTFVKEDKIILLYSTNIGITKNYHLLIIEPHDIVSNNKFIHILLDFKDGVDDNEEIVSRELTNVFKSFYDPDVYYVFWKDRVRLINNPQQFFGTDTEFDRVSVDTIKTYIWTNEKSFEFVPNGYNLRKIVTYQPTNIKTIRKNTELINVEQFDDLFIMFAKDTKNEDILNVPGINLNRNQLLYIFEKDILSNDNNTFNTLPGEGAQILSHRLYPNTISKDKQITCFNNAKNSSNSIIFSDNLKISNNIDSKRTIKNLLDGTRYVDLNSFHNKEYKIGNNFVTYELPIDKKLTSLLISTNISIDNDENVYQEKNSYFTTSDIMNNIVDGVSYERPWFQKNIIDSKLKNSLSIPLEWVDRTYKDEWITIVSTAPTDNDDSAIKIQYNFSRNIWQAVWKDENGLDKTKIYNYLYGQTISTTSQPTTSSTTQSPSGISSENPIGKNYKDLSILDLPYIFELGTYQPLSLKISSQQVYGNNSLPKYKINFKFYFKGNSKPLIDITTVSRDISSLSYIFINPFKKYNLKINYLDVADANIAPVDFIIKNLHNACLHKLNIQISPEFIVNPQLTPKQADFKYYRKITIDGLHDVSSYNDKIFYIPIKIYGNGYKGDVENGITIKYPFDFKKLAINDKSLRFYFDSSLDSPVFFKVGSYNYADEYAVIWVQLNNVVGINKNLYLYYGKINISETNLSVRSQYISLKSNICPNWILGSWWFDSQYFDERLSFADGKIYNTGEPIIYEKSKNSINLSLIDKEYMYGMARVFKSHKFGIELEIPAEESLFFDPKIKENFISFIKDTATLLKPSYTEIYNINQYGFDILESGEGNMGETTNRRVAGLVATTPNANVMTYYERKVDSKFNLLTSFNGYSKNIDWVIAKPIDTPIFKSGVFKINGKLKSETIKFETPFKDTEYYIFLASPSNQKIYWQLLCKDRFTISASHYLLKEVSWMAFHKDMFGGVYTPNSIYVGKRDITGSIETDQSEEPSVANLNKWYNHEILIRPEVGVSNDPGFMSIPTTDPGYSILLSSNENINIYWKNKESNQFRVKTSSPVATTIHWLVIRNGVEWWQELE